MYNRFIRVKVALNTIDSKHLGQITMPTSNKSLPVGSLNKKQTAVKVADGWLPIKKDTKFHVVSSQGVKEENVYKAELDLVSSTFNLLTNVSRKRYVRFETAYKSKDNANKAFEFQENNLEIFGGKYAKVGQVVFVVTQTEIQERVLARVSQLVNYKHARFLWKAINPDSVFEKPDGSLDSMKVGIAGGLIVSKKSPSKPWSRPDRIYSTFAEAKKAAAGVLDHEKSCVRNRTWLLMLSGGNVDKNKIYTWEDVKASKKKYDEDFSLKVA